MLRKTHSDISIYLIVCYIKFGKETHLFWSVCIMIDIEFIENRFFVEFGLFRHIHFIIYQPFVIYNPTFSSAECCGEMKSLASSSRSA